MDWWWQELKLDAREAANEVLMLAHRQIIALAQYMVRATGGEPLYYNK